ncbi:MAG: hypothetical protein J6V38_02860 [Kiritimatiellae bacterium]|nr:hypothetical protein [Kiritimatiellia bacterium]
MDSKRIEQLRDQYRRRSEAAYQSYQDSGVSRYLATHTRAEDIADALQIALDSVSEHNKLIDLRALVADLAIEARQLIQTGDAVDIRTFLKRVECEAYVRDIIRRK